MDSHAAAAIQVVICDRSDTLDIQRRNGEVAPAEKHDRPIAAAALDDFCARRWRTAGIGFAVAVVPPIRTGSSASGRRAVAPGSLEPDRKLVRAEAHERHQPGCSGRKQRNGWIERGQHAGHCGDMNGYECGGQ